MNHYEQEIDLYFELKGTPDSSRESYLRRIFAFLLPILFLMNLPHTRTKPCWSCDQQGFIF